MSVLISGVKPKSKAAKLGIKPGERLLSLNGNAIVDVLDYRFYEMNTQLLVKIQDALGREREVRIKKHEYDELGLEFETYLMDKQHSCRNKCIFCFIDQLPQGMRDSLYFKDDDSRLSFLFGNYITLTNLTEHEISRIIKMHISPINVSVHTTNPQLRVKMMNNRFAGDALSILKRFADAGLQINCQLVLCPEINDGDELFRTLSDLEQLMPSVGCVAAVPVGLTKYRDGLYPLIEYTKERAGSTIDTIERFAQNCLQKHGTRFVYPADEFYLKAERSIPSSDFYEDFGQLDNGVGLLALLKEEFYDAVSEKEPHSVHRRITMATGVAAAPLLNELFGAAKEKFKGLEGEVVPIRNEFFGEKITVAGLVTGGDLITQLKGRELGECLLIPSVMLRYERDIFLDDVSVDDVSRALNVPVEIVDNDGTKLLKAMIKE